MTEYMKLYLLGNFEKVQNSGDITKIAGYNIDTDLSEYKDRSCLYLDYLLAPLILCYHPSFKSPASSFNANNEPYECPQELYHDLMRQRLPFMTSFVGHSQYLDYLFWKVFLKVKGVADIFSNHYLPPNVCQDLPRTEELNREFMEDYLPSIMEMTNCDFEEVLLKIRLNRYALTKRDYLNIVIPVVEGRKNKQIYLKYLGEKRKQERMDRRLKKCLRSIEVNLRQEIVEDLLGVRSPVYNLRGRNVDRIDVRDGRCENNNDSISNDDNSNY